MSKLCEASGKPYCPMAPEQRKRAWEIGTGAVLLLVLVAVLGVYLYHQQLNRQLKQELNLLVARSYLNYVDRRRDEASYSAIHRLVQLGADVRTRVAYGENALFWLARSKHPEWVAELLDRGENVNQTYPNGNTPLMMSHDPDTTRLLLDRGADVHAVFGDGSTVLMAAVYNGPEVTRLLLQHGARVNAQDHDSRTALHQAVSLPHPDPATVRLLLDFGASPNARDRFGLTPLCMAAPHRGPAIGLLLSAGADPRIGSPLAVAALSDSVSAMRVLLRHGALVDVLDYDGASALSYAIRNASEDAVRCLVEHGANPNLKDADGSTPLELARAMLSSDMDEPDRPARYRRIIALLKQHGARS